MADIDGFFGAMQEPLAKYKESLTEKLGFNAFSMVADQYRKENFHSDILRDILDPSSPHGEGCLFLRLFLDYLVKAAEKNKPELVDTLKALNLDKEFITVRREEARTDIAIVHEKKNDNWAIIIESKMNGAGDMGRQLPRYFDYWSGKTEKSSIDYNVKAILYLNAGAIRYPDQSNWEENDPQNVNPRLIPIVGYSKEEPNLVTDWLEKCILSSDSFDAKAVLSQYTRILKKQAGDIMENEPEFVAAMWKYGFSCKDLQDFISEYPNFIAKTIQGKLSNLRKGNENGLSLTKGPEIWANNVVYFEWEVTYNNVTYTFVIDILCKTSELTLSLFIRPPTEKQQNPEIINNAINNAIEILNNQTDNIQQEPTINSYINRYKTKMRDFEMRFTTKNPDYKNGRWLTTIELPKKQKNAEQETEEKKDTWDDGINEIVKKIADGLLKPLADVTQDSK